MVLPPYVHGLALAASLILALPVCIRADTDAADRTIFAEFGIAAGGNVTIGGNLDLGLTPREVSDLVDEQMEFRAEYIAKLEKISQGLGLTNCRAIQYVALVAREGLPAVHATRRLEEMGALHGLIGRHEASFGKNSPQAAVALQNARTALERGDLPAARSLVAAVHGIAAGHDIQIRGSVTIGLPVSEVGAMLDRIRGKATRHLSRLEKLSRSLGVTNCATANFLRSLGQGSVPTEALPAKLEEIAQRHKDLIERLQRVTSRNPKISNLRRQAASAFQNGDYERFYSLLEQASAIGLSNLSETADVALDTAEARAEVCEGRMIELKYSEAGRQCEKAADLVRVHDPVVAADYLNKASGAYQNASELEDAYAALNSARKLLEDLESPEARRMLISCRTNLGTLRFARGEYRKARKEYDSALNLIEGSDGADSDDLNQEREAALNGLARVEVNLSDYKKAERHYRDALEMLETSLSDELAQSNAMAAVLSNLGDLLASSGRHTEAMSLLSRAVDVLNVVTPRNDLAFAIAVNNLARLYWDMKDLEQAHRLWSESYQILADKLGKEHLYSVSVRFNLAVVQRRQGLSARFESQRGALFEQAEEGFQLAYGTAIDLLGEAHPVTGAILNAFGELRFVRGEYDEAEEDFDAAITIAKVTPTQRGRNLTLAGYLNNRAMLHRKLGRLDQARKDYEKARKIYRRALGKNHPSLVVIAGNLAKIAEKQDKLAEAEELLSEALRVAQVVYTRGHAVIIAYQAKLARILKKRGKLDQAEEHYLAVIQATRDLHSTDHPTKVAERLFHLCDLYDKSARPAKALNCFSEAQAIFAQHLSPEHTYLKAVHIRLDRLAGTSSPPSK